MAADRLKATTVEIFQAKDGSWRFHAVARNREVGTQSEAYRRKSSAVRGAKRWHPGAAITFRDRTPTKTAGAQ